jgi:predicted aspartyl protease
VQPLILRLLPLVLLPSLAGCPLDSGPRSVDYPADEQAGEVGIRFAGMGEAALLVPVFLNGEGPFDFVLDTGATLTCVDQRLVEQLGIPQQRGAVGIGAGVEATGRLQLVRLDSVRVGQAGAADLRGCVLDLAHTRTIGIEIDGLIGLNFLRELRMTLDFSREVMTLERP